jgi:putative peptide zinc metalloprotease protein
MLQTRPTFSESWYRVAELKPRLRAGAQISRQFHRGERWYVVRDPAGNQFHRLSDAAYAFVGLLDGRRSVEECWDLVGGHLADDAPTQPEVIQILSQLYAANLLETDITPDSGVLLRRHKEQMKRKMQGRLMNVLFPRIPLWDPDMFLKRWAPVARFIFSRLGAAVWIFTLVYTVFMLAPHWDDLRKGAVHALDLQHNMENVFWLYATFVGIKLIHELGHAFSCRRFGGEVHELGVMFLVLVPTPYVDASTAWGFPSRWKRVFVGAAGMIVELFFACLCAMVWTATLGQPDALIHQLAYNAMLIASVSTLVFNANPLLRYDGYYILSDFLEIPNLSQKSKDYSLGLIKRHIFRVKLQQPLPPVGQRIWLFVYAIASGVYRVFIGAMIVLIVFFKVAILGVLMAIGGVVTWLVVPIFKISRYLLIDPELHRKRAPAMAFSFAALALFIVAVGVIRLPVHLNAEGILEPAAKQVVRVHQPGFVRQILVADGQLVHKGQPLVVLENIQLQTQLEFDKAQLNSTQAKKIADYANDPTMVKYHQDAADEVAYQKDVDLDQTEFDSLTVRAAINGVLVAPNIDQIAGQYLHNGQQIATVADIRQMRAKAVIDQKDAQLIQKVGLLKTEVRLAGNLQADPYSGQKVEVLPAAQEELPSAALGTAGGGQVTTDPHDEKGTRPASDQFEVHLLIDNNDGGIVSGQRAYVRFTIESHTLLWEWRRRFMQLINVQDTGKWI